jgi:hypothetical protein
MIHDFDLKNDSDSEGEVIENETSSK